jgi:hypothetical protein
MGRSYKKNLLEALSRPHRCTPPTSVQPPYGHECAVCGQTVRKGHPLHRAQDPARSEPRLVVAATWSATFAPPAP